MAGTQEGGKKAAAHQDMSEKGRKGAEALNSNPEKKSEASRKAAETRGHESMAAMGSQGGQHGQHSQSGGGSRSSSDEEE